MTDLNTDAIARIICRNMGLCPQGSCTDFTCCEAVQKTAREAAIRAYLAALPAEDLAARLVEYADKMEHRSWSRYDRTNGDVLDNTPNEAAKLLREAAATAPGGWVAAIDAPREWEGQSAWKYTKWDGRMEQTRIPLNYSRAPHHCDGVFFMLIPLPAAPQQDTPDGHDTMGHRIAHNEGEH